MSKRNKIYRLENALQYYTLGSADFMADILGFRKHDRPLAELWMGAHPSAPSSVMDHGSRITLIDFIKSDPLFLLGEHVSAHFGESLPFLFKILSADIALSVQAHPDSKQAVLGFNEENSRGIPLTSPQRNFKDTNGKIEMLCALSEGFHILKGFREPQEIYHLLKSMNIDDLNHLLELLQYKKEEEALRNFFSALLNLSSENVKNIVKKAGSRVQDLSGDMALAWVKKLYGEFENDIGILMPLVMQYIELKDREAVFLPSGELHSYLKGSGLEIMSNSDNVLRGGLTQKHIDKKMLLEVLNFRAEKINIINPKSRGKYCFEYRIDVEEFNLSFYKIEFEDITSLKVDYDTPQILLCLDGFFQLESNVCQQKEEFRKGDVFFIPAGIKDVHVNGKGIFYAARVPGRFS
jgi:mannose-6-phosphate isomerase